MADKEVKIRFDTSADVKGAKQAEEAIDRVEDAARDAATAIGDVNQSRSINAIEKELADLTRQLRAVSVGSKEFSELGGRIREVERELEDAHQAASSFTRRINDAGTASNKLGKAAGKNGGAGMAVLELSRALEDSQYGIRGVLNNIPGLITMLGGGAGLAGVISILAVAGVQLWEKMQEGPKKAKKEAEDYVQLVEDLAEVFEKFSKERREATERGTQNDAKRLSDLQKELQDQQSILAIESERAKRQIAADGNLAIAQERLSLAQTERSLVTATGTEALRLAREREETIKRIAAKEAEIREGQRNQDLRVAAEKVADAGKVLDTAKGDKQYTERAERDAAIAMEQNTAALIKEREKREEAVRAIEDQIKAIRAEIIKADQEQTPGFARDNATRLGQIEDLEKQLGDANKKSQVEADLEAKKDSLTKEFNAATEARIAASNAAAEADQAHAQRQKEADQLVFNQQQEQRSEQQQKVAGDLGAAQQGLFQEEDRGKDAAQRVLDSIISELGNAANSPENQAKIKSVTDLISDGVQKGESDQVSARMQDLVKQIQKDDGTRTKFVDKVIEVMGSVERALSSKFGELDEIKIRIRNLENNQGNPNH